MIIWQKHITISPNPQKPLFPHIKTKNLCQNDGILPSFGLHFDDYWFIIYQNEWEVLKNENRSCKISFSMCKLNLY